ncbi:hypothetical protein GCM10007966_03680 [Legionella impletisoli]|uniref:Mitochondrial carrier protein n=2 Tax=Legionella impletisoli TaxID=343510 RepID=A0A917JN01_9GAMM|nr:hypothetical protein GCM10007966_03680 [Legionella impletisoli]
MTQSNHENNTTQITNINKVEPKVTIAQSLTIGSIAGAAEVLIDHPLWTIKTRIQSGQPFTLNPSLLYRGVLPNAASMIPITSVQVGLNRFVQNVWSHKTNNQSSTERILSSFVAGVGSSFISCPTEMAMTYQSKAGGSFCTAVNSLVKEGGWRCLFTGLPATALRDGKFAAFFLAGIPMIKTQIRPYYSNEEEATFVAGLGAGACATLVSQGHDTLKTEQQAATPVGSLSYRNAVKQIYSNAGGYGFFKGVIPRGSRVVSAITIMGLVCEKMEAKFSQYNAEHIHDEECGESMGKTL